MIVTTSPVPSHPSTSDIEHTIGSIREHLPTAEIVIVADGVRQEQQDRRKTYEHYLREAGRQRLGKKHWRRHVGAVCALLLRALVADYVMLGGGNAKDLGRLPPGARLGSNADVVRGGYRLWLPADRRAR